jgi:hypothetical protein
MSWKEKEKAPRGNFQLPTYQVCRKHFVFVAVFNMHLFSSFIFSSLSFSFVYRYMVTSQRLHSSEFAALWSEPITSCVSAPQLWPCY